MKASRPSLLLLPLLAAVGVAGQTKTTPRPTSFIESRQGNHPDGDMVGHGKVSEGDTVRCVLVGVYDETHQSSTACMIRFADGRKHTLLVLNESMSVLQDSEAYLECAGDKPRRCMVEVNPPTANHSSVQAD
jgi:hypothetical protein